MASERIGARQRLDAERQRLLSLRDGLREGLSQESETASIEELSDNDQHPADTATETFDRERDLGTLESVEAELTDVERALERLSEGTYGRCVACGRPLPAERLEALPATPYCIDDAQQASAEASPRFVALGDAGGDQSNRAL